VRSLASLVNDDFQIITFYEFKKLGSLSELKRSLTAVMGANSVFGTVIIAEEGFNATVSGPRDGIRAFVGEAENILKTRLKYKSSFHAEKPFKRIKVKIKPEIVTLKKQVDIARGVGTHIKPEQWNRVITDPEVVILDARNDYEYKVGTFRNAVNPSTEKFSDLPLFVAENLDAAQHKKVAMFCTGGIRCEKFAPYLKGLGFEKVYQLEGGILKYLEAVPESESLWEGECFVFDERITVDDELKKGTAADLSVSSKAAIK
jgi:UPF0176 protein